MGVMSKPCKEEQRYEELTDQAAKWYIGVWNLLEKEEASSTVIINASINNMVAIMDRYMTGEQKLKMLETIIDQLKIEQSLEQEQLQ